LLNTARFDKSFLFIHRFHQHHQEGKVMSIITGIDPAKTLFAVQA